ncbi:hypothetical protein EVJ58_g8296 [Rhodofomes roseus]|uniref:Uncharacterized protein n=1 Tax=Rhodofomes roseus TaxID=34475 RepID=A0A4Y9Y1B2_9APHY|nr:hypothetical protein EVJ58_g8296 [Rhodofomes roseus]
MNFAQHACFARLPNLLHLEVSLTHSSSFADLTAAVRHAPQLQSLSLLRIEHNVEDVIPQLTSAISHLPNLTALVMSNFMHSDRLTASACAQLCAALRGRVRLRRLFCEFRVQEDERAAYLDMLSTLENLEIVNLNTNGELTARDLTALQRYLPKRLAVLWLTYSATEPLSPDTLVTFWRHFSNVTFLSLTVYSGPQAALTVDEVVHDASRSLRFLGHCGEFYDVGFPEGRPVASVAWDHGGIRETGCERWDWTMRYLYH